jgi:hypothetical protein
MDAARQLIVNGEKITLPTASEIKKAVQSGVPLMITTCTLPHKTEMHIEKILEMFLRAAGQERLKDYVTYCVWELAANAKRANTKRVYFMERGLDLNDPNDYKLGMINFKKDTLGNISHYSKIQKEKGFYVKLIIQMKQDVIHIEIRNNAVVTRAELMRIHDKLVNAQQYTSLEDALSRVLDSSEGAGLGLVILTLMLRKIGLNEDCFDILVTEQETIARIVIPPESA